MGRVEKIATDTIKRSVPPIASWGEVLGIGIARGGRWWLGGTATNNVDCVCEHGVMGRFRKMTSGPETWLTPIIFRLTRTDIATKANNPVVGITFARTLGNHTL
jgi:hypothetical protein